MSVFAALGADLIAAVEAPVITAGSTDPTAVRDTLASLKDVQGATGLMTFEGQLGVPVKDVALITVSDGQVAYVESIQPAAVPAP